MGWTSSILSFEQMKSLIMTDFFTIEQIKIIKKGLEQNETFPIKNLEFSDEQIRVLRSLGVMKE